MGPRDWFDRARDGRRATTLLETVIALFLIAGGMAVLAALYASTMGSQDKDVQASVMVLLAKSRIAELRADSIHWAGFRDLDTQSGTVTPPDYPDFQVETTVQAAQVPYPCPGLRSIDFVGSYKRVQVVVTGPDGRKLTLATRVGAPPNEVDALVVTQTAGSSPLARDAQADFQAELHAADGSTIPDLQFEFYLDFTNGYGRLQEDPDGKTVHFFNQIVNVTGPNMYTGGEVRIVARTFYAGKEYRGESALVSLTP